MLVENQENDLNINCSDDLFDKSTNVLKSQSTTLLSPESVDSGCSTSDLDRQIEQLRRCEIITESEVKNLCSKAREILLEESNVQRVDAPVTVSAPVF